MSISDAVVGLSSSQIAAGASRSLCLLCRGPSPQTDAFDLTRERIQQPASNKFSKVFAGSRGKYVVVTGFGRRASLRRASHHVWCLPRPACFDSVFELKSQSTSLKLCCSSNHSAGRSLTAEGARNNGLLHETGGIGCGLSSAKQEGGR